ncbi:MAG TPA: D-alanine--D-alanine ligase family protein [Miltoncostaeaceae bacterium]|nr:D-alanine--D-alanine ligase family protein [Miltoncostaeaceae bacterium]
MTRVLVLMGGRSGEHDVSLVSARGVMEALATTALDTVPVRIGREGAWTRDGRPVGLCAGPDGRALLVALDGAEEPLPVDVVFPVLHGPYGEDGTVQGLCEMAGVAYVGAGVAASSVAMDKALFKTLALAHDLPVAEAVVLTATDLADQPAAVRAEIAHSVGYPCFVKPARLGSSLGISRVAGAEALDAALDAAFAHDDKVLVERAITGREVEVGVLGADGDLVVSPPGEIRYEGEWYDYATKYEAGRAELVVPADMPPEVAARTADLAAAAFTMVGCHGLARVDFFVTAAGEVLVSELNTMPGFTPTSAYPSLMAAAGVPYPEVVARLVALARSRHARSAAPRDARPAGAAPAPPA